MKQWSGPRNDLPAQVKASAVRRVYLHGERASHVAREIGVHRNTIRNWAQKVFGAADAVLEQGNVARSTERTEGLNEEIRQKDRQIEYFLKELSAVKKNDGT